MKQTNKEQCGNYYLVSYFNPEMVKSEVREVKGVFINFNETTIIHLIPKWRPF